MKIIRALHETAMEYADRAFIAKAKGDADAAREFYQKAFELEREAALEMPLDDIDTVPRFILLRSAAALAFKAGKYADAEKFIQVCLSGNPPGFIVREVQEIQALILSEQGVSR